MITGEVVPVPYVPDDPTVRAFVAPARSGAGRVLLVGEGNPYSARPHDALYPLPRGASGDRLRNLMGLTDVEYLRFARCNLCVGTSFTLREARPRAELLSAYWRGQMVLCGAKAASAFDLPTEPFKTHDVGGTAVYVIPHPSGLSRAWNAPGSAQRLREFLAHPIDQVRA